MPMVRQCPITDISYLTGDIVSITVDAGEIARSAGPGQFVNLKCGEGVAGDLLTVVFQVKGEGTRWLAARQAGDVLDVLGPLGHGYEIPDGRVLVVGGGIGVPPMLYAAKCCHGADACVGFRSREQAILLEELGAVCGEVRVASDDGSIGAHGFVDALVRQALAEKRYDAVFACGPRPMLHSVARAAAEGHTACYVSMEERMGCGIGACLVCACSVGGHHRHVCKDGPVFRAEEVDW